MARATFNLDAESFNRLVEAMQEYQDNIPKAINEVLWNEGGPLINDAIMQLLPASGRTWRGKAKSAKQAAPFTQQNEELSVTIKTKSAYNYLYFPDDGSTTRKHAGNKQFMFGGAELEQDEIINRCIAKLKEKLN